MYISKFYRHEDRARILGFLKQNEFAMLVTYDGEKPITRYLLFEVTEEGDSLFLNGHMSKANPLWKMFESNPEVLVIFQGPHTYFSPKWYNHINMPRRNYQAVRLYDSPRIVGGDEYYAIPFRLISHHSTNHRQDGYDQDV